MKFFRSIRWQLQLWHGLLLLIVLCAFGFTAYHLEKTERTRENDAGIQYRLSLLVNTLRAVSRTEARQGRSNGPPQPPTFKDNELTTELDAVGLSTLFASESGYYFAIWMREAQPVAVSPGGPGNIPRPAEKDAASRQRGEFREAFIFAAPVDCVLVGRSMAATNHAILLHAVILAGAGAVLLTVGLVVGSWLSNRAIKPVREISKTATRIASGDLSQRINVTEAESELGSLASVLNSTFARLDAAFSQQGRFTADAAHELRTPLAVLLTRIQSALARERSVSDYQQTLASTEATVQRMRRLVESLLELARLDAGQESLHRVPCDLAEVASECAELMQPLANAKGVTIKLNLSAARCNADPLRIAQVATNLLKNAIDYNRQDGTVDVVSYQENDMATLEIADSGVGIPEADLPHIFERFYRADESRASNCSGTGLGLALSKAIIDSHGGHIEVTSSDKGSTFKLAVPRA